MVGVNAKRIERRIPLNIPSRSLEKWSRTYSSFKIFVGLDERVRQVLCILATYCRPCVDAQRFFTDFLVLGDGRG